MAEVNSVHHINFVVRNLEKSVTKMAAILNQTPQYDELAGRKVKTARFNLNGLWLVLVQPLDNQSEVGQILEKRGEGLFLLSLATDSLQNSAEDLATRGAQMADSGARQGLMDWQVWDLDDAHGLGAIIQICQSDSE